MKKNSVFKNEDLIVEGLLPYLVDKNNRAVIEDKDVKTKNFCVFNTEDGRHCFAGNFLLDIYKEQGTSFEYNETYYSSQIAMYFRLDFTNLGQDLICDIQELHDKKDYWENESKFWDKLKSICEEHSLEFNYIKTELLSEKEKTLS